MLAIGLTIFLLGLSVAVASKENFVVMKQDNKNIGNLEIISGLSGQVSKTSDVSITFTWPYVEMTSDEQNGKVYVTAFPDNSSQAILYQFNSELELEHTWPNTEFWFFDLQYAPSQKSLYGIKVTSTYGRVLSNFSTSVDDRVEATELFTLPYMWYVNASTFDHKTTRYFGLINYFPGKPESILDQQLVTCNFASSSDCKVVPISNSSGILQFISYSCKNGNLYFSSLQKNWMNIGILDPYTGKITRLLYSAPAAELGPISVQDELHILSVFVKNHPGDEWELLQVDLTSALSHTKTLRSFSPISTYTVFAAATKF